jgi:crossover junction endodeoxyribonuclease RusA
MNPTIADMEAEAAEAVLRINLAWPDKRLSPNARTHWRAKVGPKQAAKISAGWATHAAKGFYALRDALKGTTGPIPVSITFHPPDARRRDLDNCIGSLKAAQDAVAQALGVDDARFVPTYRMAPPEKPGRVEISIQGTEAA